MMTFCWECRSPLRETRNGVMTCDTPWCLGNIDECAECNEGSKAMARTAYALFALAVLVALVGILVAF